MPQPQYFQGLWHSFFFLTVKDGIILHLSAYIYMEIAILQVKLYFSISCYIGQTPITFYILPTFCRTFVVFKIYFTLKTACFQDFFKERREFDSCIIKKVLAGLIKPVLFLSNFSFYYLVIFSDIWYNYE